MTVGEKIRAIRKAKPMTQKELAGLLGISSVNISQIENNVREPKIDTLEKIADALEVSLAELLGIMPKLNKEYEDIFNTLNSAGLHMVTGEGDSTPNNDSDRVCIWHTTAPDISTDMTETTYGELRRIVAEVKHGAEVKALEYIRQRLDLELF